MSPPDSVHEPTLQGLTLGGSVRVTVKNGAPCRAPLSPDFVKVFESAMQTRPPEFLSIIGPRWAGKSTVVHQLKEHGEVKKAGFLWIVVDIEKLPRVESSVECMRSLLMALSREIATFTEDAAIDSAQSDDLLAGLDLKSCWERLDQILGDLNHLSVCFDTPLNKKIVVLENVDRLHSDCMENLFRYLRDFKETRARKEFFDITLLGTAGNSLAQRYGDVTSPFNVVNEMRLEDHSRISHAEFLASVAERNRIKIEDDAEELLFHVSNGFLLITQTLLSYCGVKSDLSAVHVAKAVARCLLAEGLLINTPSSPAVVADAQHVAILDDLVHGKPCLRKPANLQQHSLRWHGLIKNKPHADVQLRTQYEAWKLMSQMYSEVNVECSNRLHVLRQIPMLQLLLRSTSERFPQRDQWKVELSRDFCGMLIQSFFECVLPGGACVSIDEIVEAIEALRRILPREFYRPSALLISER
jgi:hypothetical protein